jgi:UDP-GlcNAc:undecaprenyl-phosphate GlcNAc-1-phosphate transferase
VQSLPLVVSFAIGLAVAPAAVRSLEAQRLVRENYRGALVAFPAGVAILAAALVALVPLALLDELADQGVLTSEPPVGLLGVVAYVLGVGMLGLLDDLAGSEPAGPRGWRGHARAVLGGGFSTGALKAIGALGLALLALSGAGLDAGEYLLAVALLVLATNLFNLLDLRPGRSIKALVLLGAALTVGTRDADPLWALGLFVGPVLALLPLDLRERGMLGDTGSNAVGAVAGLWLVLALPVSGQLVALALVAIATLYGEFRSISELIERTPGLRHLDSLGRTQHYA